MKIETILNAMTFAQARIINSDLDLAHLRDYHNRSERQYEAFRARILREFAILQNFAEVNGFDRTQAWFWTDEWQEREREVDEYLDTNKVQSFDTMENYLRSLEANDD